MDLDQLGAFLVVVAVVSWTLLRYFWWRKPLTFITNYQRGLRFVDGAFQDVLGPGAYRANGSRRQITVVDMRPRLVLAERIFYNDALQSPSVISVAARVSVSDVYTATTKLKDVTRDSSAIFRDAVRATVSRSVAAQSERARRASENDIQKVANAELEKFGVTVSDVEITEVWSRAVISRKTSGAN